MSKKLFPIDKNYILRQAQDAIEKEMMGMMVDELKKAFTLLFNPLELQDDTYLKILSEKAFPEDHLSIIYKQLAGIFRFIVHPESGYAGYFRQDQRIAWTRYG